MRHTGSSRARRARRGVGLVALATAAAVVLAACGGTTKNDSAAKSAPLPGLTADTVNVGFTISDIGALAKALGFKQADYGGVALQTKGVQAVISYINANGGMGGRKVTGIVKSYLGSGDSTEQGAKRCSDFTQDNKVLGVVLQAGFQNNEIPCFKAANTMVLDQRLFAHDTTQFKANDPYLWSPTFPEYSGFLGAQLKAMNDAKFFDGNTGVLLMPSDDEVSRRVTETVAKPYLASIGITKTTVAFVDGTNTGTLGATSAAALTAGKNAGLNRVVVIGGARIESVALSDVNAVGYKSTWGLSTYDSPVFMQDNPGTIVAELRVGMTGIGFMPAADVSDGKGPAFPDPTNKYEKTCVDVMTAAGAAPPQNLRTNWKSVLLFCDGAMFLKAVLDQAPKGGTVTARDFADAAGKIGSTYGSALGFGSAWGPGIHAGTNTAQVLHWDLACQCMNYVGGNVTFGEGPTGAVAPAASPSGAVQPEATITVAAP